MPGSRLFPLALTAAVSIVVGQLSDDLQAQPPANPTVVVRQAPPLRFPGAKSDAPDHDGASDCNSPAHWDGDRFFIFNSAGSPWRSSGTDVGHLRRAEQECQFDQRALGGRWIEATWKARDGLLYGWYHLEPEKVCEGRRPTRSRITLTAPRIGAVRSRDNGANWEDLGIILLAQPVLRCNSRNSYFAGGNGDFSVMLDRNEEYLYFLFSTYAGTVGEQGVAMARMRWADRNHPTGKVTKWYAGRWTEPGLGGRATPVFRAEGDWHGPRPVAFWGPSIHWNTHLEKFVVLLNHARDSRWAQEGIYTATTSDLSRPLTWTEPRKLLAPAIADRWYPQVIGSDSQKKETDKLAGRIARLFVRGISYWELVFHRPI